MALNSNNLPRSTGNKTQQPNLEPGAYPARVVRVYDLGLQPQRPFPGDPKPKAPVNQIHIIYELTDAFMVDEEGNELTDKPRWVNEEFALYPLSSDRAKSTARYSAIDPKGVHKGDWAKVLGSPVNVNIVNNPSKKGDGRIYDNVDSLSPIRARDAANLPELVNPAYFFDLSDPDLKVFESIPKFIQDKIKENLEFPGSALEALLKGEKPKAAKKEAPPKEDPEDEGTDGDDEDIPW